MHTLYAIFIFYFFYKYNIIILKIYYMSLIRISSDSISYIDSLLRMILENLSLNNSIGDLFLYLGLYKLLIFDTMKFISFCE